jgi:hypothetical protein
MTANKRGAPGEGAPLGIDDQAAGKIDTENNASTSSRQPPRAAQAVPFPRNSDSNLPGVGDLHHGREVSDLHSTMVAIVMVITTTAAGDPIRAAAGERRA